MFHDVFFSPEEKKKKLREKRPWMGEAELMLVRDEKTLASLVSKAILAPECALDTECTGLDTRILNGEPASRIVGYSFCFEDNKAYYVPIRHKSGNLSSEVAFRELGRLTGNSKLLVFFNFNYDGEMMFIEGVPDLVDGSRVCDVMVLSHLESPNKIVDGLKKHSKRILDKEMIELSDLFPSAKQMKKSRRFPVETLQPDQIADYAASDAMMTRELYLHFRDLPFVREQKRTQVIEFGVLPCVRWMERNRCLTDRALLRRFLEGCRKRAADIESRVHELAGIKFNVGSTEQTAKILFERLKLPTEGVRKTQKGYSTEAEELEKLHLRTGKKHEILKEIIRYRKATHSITTYILPLLETSDSEGLVKMRFDPIRTASGRFASRKGKKEDNDGYCGIQAQNIVKIRGVSEEPNIREAFIARPGYKIVAIDYAAEELRLAAMLSGEPFWVKAFKDGFDPHLKMAEILFGKKIDKSTPEGKRLRQIGKICNFMLIFGGTWRRLQQELEKEGIEVSDEEAQNLIDRFFGEVRVYKKFMRRCIQATRRRGYSKTLFDRRRDLPNINLDGDDPASRRKRSSAENASINHVVQGTAADILKMAMARVYKWIRLNNLTNDVLMILTVHDELVFEIREPLVPKLVPEIGRIMMLEDKMSEAVHDRMRVPLEVEASVGDSWGRMMDFDKYLAEMGGNAPEEDIETVSLDSEDDGEQIEIGTEVLLQVGRPFTREKISILAGMIKSSPGPVPVCIEIGGERIGSRTLHPVDEEVFFAKWRENRAVLGGHISLRPLDG